MSAFPQTLADSGGGVVGPYPSASRVFGAAEEGIGEGGIAYVYPNNGEGVLFSHKLLMGITVRSIKDGEGGSAGGVLCGLHWGQGPWRR